MPDWMNVEDSPDVNAVSTGNYGLLSVELCRLTGDMKYCDRAYQTAWWLDNHMVNPEGLLWDHYNSKNCELKDWVLTCKLHRQENADWQTTPDYTSLSMPNWVMSPRMSLRPN